MNRLFLVLGVAGLFAFLNLHAADPTPEDIAKAIKRLGHEDFDEREKAEDFLWRAGKAAEAALKEAAKSDDPETSARATSVLEKFQWGILPDTPKDVAEQIDKYRTGGMEARRGVLQNLLQMGGKGFPVIARLVERDTDPKVPEHLRVTSMVRELARYGFPVLIAEKNDKAVEQLFEIALSQPNAETARSYAAYKFLNGKADETIKKETEQFEKDPNGNAADILIGMYRLTGDLDKARDIAQKSRAHLVPVILRQQHRWKELADSADKNTIEGTSHRVLYLNLARESKDAAEATENLKKMVKDFNEGDENLWVLGRNLMLTGSPKAGLNAAGKGNHELDFVKILVARQEFQEAFKRIEKADSGEDSRVAIQAAKMQYMVGDRNQAKKQFQKLLDKADEESDLEAFVDMIEMENRLGLKDNVCEHTATLIKTFGADRVMASIARHLYRRQDTQAFLMWRALRDRMDKAETKDVVAKLDDVMRGRLPEKELDELVDRMLADAKDKDPRTREAVEKALAEVCLAAKREDRAKKLLETSNPFRLGDLLASQKKWADAAVWYGKAWEKDKGNALPLLLRGWSLVESGKKEEGEALIKRADLMLLGDGYARCQVIDDLMNRGAESQVIDQVKRVLALGESFDVNHVLRTMTRLHLRRHEYQEAADCLEQSLLDLLSPRNVLMSSEPYLIWPAYGLQMRAQADLKAGKIESAVKHAKAAQEYGLGRVDTTIDLVRAFDKAGKSDDAKTLFEPVFAFHAKLCKDYPKSATFRNSVAWLAARSGRRLDEALAYATKAVELEPKNASILDTLAETHFQRGEKDKAIETMKKCIALEPTRSFFAKQLERYKKGDKSADLPETD